MAEAERSAPITEVAVAVRIARTEKRRTSTSSGLPYCLRAVRRDLDALCKTWLLQRTRWNVLVCRRAVHEVALCAARKQKAPAQQNQTAFCLIHEMRLVEVRGPGTCSHNTQTST